MNNKYSEIFKDITPEKWKEICNKCLTNKNLCEYFGLQIPANVINYYNHKFGYKCPLDAHSKDERGHKYGKMIVQDFAGRNSRGEILWSCRCDCGTIEIRSGATLRDSGQNAMCEVCRKNNMSKIQFKNLTGHTINKLYVEKRIGTRPNSGNVIYQCLCLNCGNRINASSGALKSGQLSCGCINSKGEYLLNKILNELQIEYKTQYSFPDCKHIIPLRFDFAIFDQGHLICLIEFQGQQHYQKVYGTWRDTEEDFKLRQKRDEIKREYCKNKNIPLIEIPYKDLPKLNKQYLLNLLHPFNSIRFSQLVLMH